MRKNLCLVLCIVMFATLITGCTSAPAAQPAEAAATSAPVSESSQDAAPAAKTVITYWNGFTGPDGEALKELTDLYNQTNTMNVEVVLDIMPWDVLYQKLASALPVGEGPDIIAFNTENIGTYAKPGAIAVLDDIYASGGIDASVIPSALNDNLKIDGKYYGVPQNFATLLLYYNKDMFKAAGLDPEKPPKDWDELEQYALALTKTGTDAQYGFGLATNNTIPMWPIMIWGGGGDFMGSNGESVFNSKENVDTITRWASLIKNNQIAPPTMTGGEIDKLFESQKLAMYFCGPWATGGFTKAGINYGVAPAPAGPGKNVTLGTSVAMVMTAATKNKEAVYDYFKYWNSIDTQVEWSLKTGFPLARTDAINDARLSANPYVIDFSKVANDAQFYLQQLTNYSTIDNEVIIPAIETILLTNADIQKTLDDAAVKMNGLLGK